MYLKFQDSHQRGHESFHLPTNKIITRGLITLLPITQTIIDYVSDLAKHEGMPQGLKISNKNDRILYNSLQIAEVDTTIHKENTINKKENNQNTTEKYDKQIINTKEESHDNKMHPDNVAGFNHDY